MNTIRRTKKGKQQVPTMLLHFPCSSLCFRSLTNQQVLSIPVLFGIVEHLVKVLFFSSPVLRGSSCIFTEDKIPHWPWNSHARKIHATNKISKRHFDANDAFSIELAVVFRRFKMKKKVAKIGVVIGLPSSSDSHTARNLVQLATLMAHINMAVPPESVRGLIIVITIYKGTSFELHRRLCPSDLLTCSSVWKVYVSAVAVFGQFLVFQIRAKWSDARHARESFVDLKLRLDTTGLQMENMMSVCDSFWADP